MSWLGKIGATITLLFTSIGSFFGFYSSPTIPTPVPIQQSATTTEAFSTSTNLIADSSSTPSRLAKQAAFNAKLTFSNCPAPVKNGLVILGYDLVTDTALDRSCATATSTMLIYDGSVYLVPEPNDATWGGRAALVPNADPRTFAPLDYEYWEDESHIYYQQFQLPGADPTSWLKMSDVSLREHHFSKDKNHVYFYNQIVPNVDPASFELVSSTTARDSQAVYLYRTGDGVILGWNPQTVFPAAPLAIATGYAKFSTVKGSSPSSVITLKNGFSKDSTNVYYQSQWVNGADPSTFAVLTGNFAKDATAVWYYSRFGSLVQLHDVDASTFSAVNPEALDNGYSIAWGKDKNSVFNQDSKLDGADPTSFQADLPNDQFYNYYAKDKNHVYYQNKILDGADPSTFAVLTGNFAKDATAVWYYSRFGSLVQLHDVDASTFSAVNPEALDNGYSIAWGKDKNSVFNQDSKLDGADPTSFQADLPNDQFYNYYAKDKNHVYYQNKILDGIDPATFQIIDDGSQKDCGYRAVVADKNGYYSQTGIKFDGNVDATTFEILGMGYSRDKSHVWQSMNLIPYANPATFKTPECGIG